MKFDHKPTFSPGVPGPWGVDSTSTDWYIVNRNTLRGRRIGRVGGKKINYFDRACEEANRLNSGSFQDLAEKMLRDMGARFGNRDYPIELDTKAGLLRISVWQNDMVTRFDDVECAKSVLGNDLRLNPYSGKWNWHFVGPAGEQEVEFLRDQIGRLLADKGGAA